MKLAKKTCKRLLSLMLVLAVLIPCVTEYASAYMFPTENSKNGSWNIICYPQDKNTRSIPAYSSTNLTGSKSGTIYGSDRCIIKGYSGNSLKVSYPAGNGTKTLYVDQSYFSKGDLCGGYSIAMENTGSTVTVYRYASGSESMTTWLKGETAYVVYIPAGQYNNGVDRLQLIVPLGGDMWAMGWVNTRQLETVAKARATGCSRTISDGRYQIKAMSGYVIDAGGDLLASSVRDVHLWEQADVPAQYVNATYVNGAYKLDFEVDGGNRVLDQQGAGMNAGARCTAQPYNGGDNQLWYVFLSDGAAFIFNKKSGLSLDIEDYRDRANGTDILCWWFNGQSYKLVTASARSSGGSSAELDATVTTSSYNLLIRKSASTSSATAGSMPKGASLKVLDNGAMTNGYYHIRYNGITGYASASYITIGQAAASASVSSGNWRSPLNNYSPTFAFGKKGSDGRYHCGIDIKSSDTRVFAAVSGTVLYASKKNSSGSYADTGISNGIHVVIKSNIDGKTVYTYYCHMSSVSVSTGDSVSAGTQIGVMGSTGRSTGPHLHFGIFTGTQSTDPIGYTYANPDGRNKVSEGGRIFYDPAWVLANGRLPD